MGRPGYSRAGHANKLIDKKARRTYIIYNSLERHGLPAWMAEIVMFLRRSKKINHKGGTMVQKMLLLWLGLILLAAAPALADNKLPDDTCYATGDMNDDGIALTVTDMIYLVRFVNMTGPPPQPLYMGDLNGDCYIDQLDVEVYECYFAYGLSCFSVYPVPTCCNPDTIRGACCNYELDTCLIFAGVNCDMSGGDYQGDGVSCDPDPCEIVCDCEPGNADGDGPINILDITYLINHLYQGGEAPIPYAICSGDPNCNCAVNILDVTYLINFLYKGGPAPCTCEEWLSACGPPLS